jgi:hypothetical protein
MFIKKISVGVLIIFALTGCAQNTALLGPAYTYATSGSIYHASLSYGSDKAVNKITGKSTAQNIKEILTPKKKDSEFQKLVKKRIKETRKKLNLTSQ